MNYEKARSFVLKKLEDELGGGLYYHGLHHTLDVTHAAEEIAGREGIDGNELTLIKTACLYHDTGFIDQYFKNEPVGCRYAQQTLHDFGYTDEQIERICGMIMATAIPQSPKNHSEQIVCDADLDYLGRGDFYTIGETLFKELRERDVIKTRDEWNKLQISFLSNHKYFTESSKALREPVKQQHLDELKQLVADSST